VTEIKPKSGAGVIVIAPIIALAGRLGSVINTVKTIEYQPDILVVFEAVGNRAVP